MYNVSFRLNSILGKGSLACSILGGALTLASVYLFYTKHLSALSCSVALVALLCLAGGVFLKRKSLSLDYVHLLNITASRNRPEDLHLKFRYEISMKDHLLYTTESMSEEGPAEGQNIIDPKRVTIVNHVLDTVEVTGVRGERSFFAWLAHWFDMGYLLKETVYEALKERKNLSSSKHTFRTRQVGRESVDSEFDCQCIHKGVPLRNISSSYERNA